MSVKLLAERHLEFLSSKEAAQARLSLHLSKCHIVGNHMSRLNYVDICTCIICGFHIMLTVLWRRCLQNSYVNILESV